MMCHEEEGFELRSLVGNSLEFTNKCEEIFDGFSSDLSAAQQVYAVLYVAEFLLGVFDVGYGARSVHDVKDLEDLAEPSDDELGCEQALGEFYL